MLEVTNLIDQLQLSMERIGAAEVFLHESPRHLIGFFTSSTLPMWIKDVNSRMLIVNNAFEKAFGITVERYNKHFDGEFFVKESVEIARAQDREVITENQSKLYENYYINPDTEERSKVFIFKYPLYIDGEIKGIGGIVFSADLKASLLS